MPWLVTSQLKQLAQPMISIRVAVDLAEDLKISNKFLNLIPRVSKRADDHSVYTANDGGFRRSGDTGIDGAENEYGCQEAQPTILQGLKDLFF